MLQAERDEHDKALDAIEDKLTALDQDSDTVAGHGESLAALAQYPSWSELDAESASAALARLEAEREALVAGSSQLAAIDEQLAALDSEDARLGADAEDVIGQLGGARTTLTTLEARQRREEEALALMGPGVLESARTFYPALSERVTRADTRTVEDCDRLRETLTGELTSAIEATQREMNGYTTGIQQQMGEFLRRWPDLRTELDANVQAIGGGPRAPRARAAR